MEPKQSEHAAKTSTNQYEEIDVPGLPPLAPDKDQGLPTVTDHTEGTSGDVYAVVNKSRTPAQPKTWNQQSLMITENDLYS